MKTVGLIGGMSWESTVDYYRIINTYVKETLGGLHSARLILYSVEFEEIERCQSAGDWQRSGEILGEAAHKLELAGADLIVLCTNTMHKNADAICARIDVPFLHIADMTAEALEQDGIERVGLLGSCYTMEQDFYKGRLQERGFDVLVPNEEDRAIVNRVIFEELCLGKILDGSRQEYSRIIEQLRAQGAQAVILGCTEIGMLIKQKDSVLPVYDTTYIHATRAARYMLDD